METIAKMNDRRSKAIARRSPMIQEASRAAGMCIVVIQSHHSYEACADASCGMCNASKQLDEAIEKAANGNAKRGSVTKTLYAALKVGVKAIERYCCPPPCPTSECYPDEAKRESMFALAKMDAAKGESSNEACT